MSSPSNLEKGPDEQKKSQKGISLQSSTRRTESIATIFRYADWTDILLMLLGTIGAIGDGMSTNVLLVFASQIMNSLGTGKQDGHGSFMEEVERVRN